MPCHWKSSQCVRKSPWKVFSRAKFHNLLKRTPFGKSQLRLCTETHTAEWTWFSKRIHVKLVTHMGFFLHLSLKWRYTICKTLCFTFIVDFSAACPLCLYGSAVKIALCHAQSINSPIATHVIFASKFPPNGQVKRCQLTTNTILAMTKTMTQSWLNSGKRFSS